jgi:hypothetical protein
MPPKYRRSTPVKDRIYRSSPALVQSKLANVRQTVKYFAMVPPSTMERRQSTLTQMEFGRKFGLDAEIADSDEEDDDYVEEVQQRPKKKAKTVERSFGTPGLLKQSTLTQMDFGRIMHGIPDSDDEDMDQEVELEVSGVEEATAHNLLSVHDIEEEPLQTMTRQQHAEDPESYGPGCESHASPRYEPSSVIQSPELCKPNEQPHETPQTPRHPRTKTIPSSQTPSATPISIPNTRRLPAQEDPISPTPARRISPPSRPRLSSPSTRKKDSFPTIMAPPAKPVVKRSAQKEQTPEIETTISPVTQPLVHTQSQTQTTPRTKIKIRDFNRRWEELTGGPQILKPKLGTLVEENSFSMSEQTQEMLLEIDMSALTKVRQSSPDGHHEAVRFAENDPKVIEAGANEWEEESQLVNEEKRAEYLLRLQKREVIVIESSQDSEGALDCSQVTEVEEPASHHTRYGQHSIVPVSSPRIRGSPETGFAPRATNNIVLDTQHQSQHVLQQPFPSSSQASTTAGTPLELFAESNRIVATSAPRHIDHADDEFPPMENEADFGEESIASTIYPNQITVSQLLPSSLLESVPRPPIEPDTQYDIEDEDEEAVEDDEL